jgi:epsilon-lactone hydrolase
MSLAALATNVYLRSRVKAKKGSVIDVERVRNNMKALTAKAKPVPADLRHTPVAATAERCAAEWLEPASGGAREVLYFHGGGYFFCDLDTHRPLCGYLSRHAKARVLSVNYRLAPEAPFPAAVDDALAWYRTLDPTRLVVAGDSAGGGLALACLLAAREAGLAMPRGAVLFSPWTDLSCSGETMTTLADADVMFRAEHLPMAAALYLHGVDARTPLASPLFADLRGLPPLKIFASQDEVMRSDAERLHERARESGVQSALTLERRLPHAWPTMLHLPEAKDSLRQTAAFIEACTP